MLVTSLAQTPGLDVIGNERLEASFRELGRAPSDRPTRHEVARHAGAGAVLVGTLFKVGSDTRLDVQVQDVETGRVVAARSSQQGPDLFALVDALAQRRSQPRSTSPNRPAGRPLRDVTTASLEAYELYAKAQRARHNNRWSDARTLFEEALRIDPAFTLARAQLVKCSSVSAKTPRPRPHRPHRGEPARSPSGAAAAAGRGAAGVRQRIRRARCELLERLHRTLSRRRGSVRR